LAEISKELGNLERTGKLALFFGGPGRQLMTAQLRVHALDLPERTSFTAKDAR
jgi:hypothetical protein